MSRIAGLVEHNVSSDQLTGDLERLLSPMRHSTDFDVETALALPSALGRVYFTDANLLAHLARIPELDATCVFLGYLRDYAKMVDRVRTQTRDQGSIRNQADLVARLYLKNGPSVLADLNGSYVFALWTANDQTLRIGTDRWGMPTLYYRHSGRRFAFASEIRALLNLEPDGDVNMAALQELFTIGAPVGDHTLYPTILRLPPATVLTLHDGRLSLERYWWYDRVKSIGSPDPGEFIEELYRRFKSSMAGLLGQVEKPICMLSSGFDSRRIFLEMAAQNRTPVAYTASIAQPVGRFEIDLLTSDALCREFDVPHVTAELAQPEVYAQFTRQVQALVDFETDAHAWIMPLLPKIPAGSGINFDGTGGDVLEDGNFTRQEQADNIDDCTFLARSVIDRFPNLWSSHFSLPQPEPPLEERLTRHFERLPNFDHRFTIFYFMNWTRRKTSLFSQRLISLKCDSVYPFLDYDFVELLLSVSPMWKREHKIRAAFLDHVNAGLQSRLPSSHMEDIYVTPDQKYRRFCRPIPEDYWPRIRASVYRTVGRDLVRTPRVFAQLSRQAKLAAIAFELPGPSTVAPRWMTSRAWALRLIGLYTLQRRIANDPQVGRRLRADARAFIYDRSATATVAEYATTR